MKKFLVKIAGLSAILFLLQIPVFSQDKVEPEKDKPLSDKVKTTNDEIIIIKKGDKDGKVTVETKDGKVLVNGKPMDEFQDDNFSVKEERWSGMKMMETLWR